MVADVLSEFLEVAVHLILYVREVYPVGIFQKRKKYNVPVQVSPGARLDFKNLYSTYKLLLFLGKIYRVALPLYLQGSPPPL